MPAASCQNKSCMVKRLERQSTGCLTAREILNGFADGTVSAKYGPTCSLGDAPMDWPVWQVT
eukprot:3345293-Amphidinium_carterae.1